jgi:hypothetical protein
METFTMSRKEMPRPGLIAAALAGRITNREGATVRRLRRALGVPAVHQRRPVASPRHEDQVQSTPRCG